LLHVFNQVVFVQDDVPTLIDWDRIEGMLSCIHANKKGEHAWPDVSGDRRASPKPRPTSARRHQAKPDHQGGTPRV